MAELNELATWIADRYECLEKLGEGSTGTVWLAKDHVRNETIALRCLEEDILSEIGGFEEAAKLLITTTNFRHPSVISVFDFAPSDGVVYVSLKRQKGVTLKNRLAEARTDASKHFTEETILEIIKTILNVLQEGIATGWAHAGIKPENVWLTRDGNVCLSEYGLHHLLSLDALKSSAALLRTGKYLAPEMYEHHVRPNFQTDQFALGTLWTELIQASDLHKHPSTFQRHRSIIQKLTETSPEDRYQDVAALMHAFQTTFGTVAPETKTVSPHVIDQWMEKKRWKTWLVWTPALLLLIPLWQEWAFRSPDITSHVLTRTELQNRIRDLETERINLFGEGYQHVMLRPHLKSLFSNIYPIEALLEMGDLSEPDPPSRMEYIQSKVETEHHRVRQGRELVRLFALIETWLEHAQPPTLTEAGENEVWPERLITSRETALASLKLGQLDTAVQKLDQSFTQLQTELASALEKQKQSAYASRTRWERLLSTVGTPYAEPQENLSMALDQLTYKGTGPECVTMIREARRIQQQYEHWSTEWQQLPEPPANAYRNSLGMFFAPVGDMQVSIWETRVIDFYHFITESGFDANRSWREEAALTSPVHPVSTITRYGAAKFCEWLTKKEHATGQLSPDSLYALPTDLEWSQLAGLNHEEEDWPVERHFNAPGQLPWKGNPVDYSNHGNYFTQSSANASNNFGGKKDRWYRTAPVGRFEPNGYGLFDVGGNVMEWVTTEYIQQTPPYPKPHYTLRGGGWRTLHPEQMRVGHRIHAPSGLLESGFRCILKKQTESHP